MKEVHKDPSHDRQATFSASSLLTAGMRSSQRKLIVLSSVQPAQLQ